MDFTYFECHKSVNSGKALGGHLSSPHVMVKRELNLEKLKKKLKLPENFFYGLWEIFVWAHVFPQMVVQRNGACSHGQD